MYLPKTSKNKCSQKESQKIHSNPIHENKKLETSPMSIKRRMDKIIVYSYDDSLINSYLLTVPKEETTQVSVNR